MPRNTSTVARAVLVSIPKLVHVHLKDKLGDPGLAPATESGDSHVVARDAHRDQMRRSGDPYIAHPLGVAMILARLGMDDITLAGALLHDSVEDTRVTLDEVVDLPAGAYSHGQSRRLSMAMALVARPPLLLVDEPFEHAGPSWGPGQRSYDWSPDGRRLAFSDDDGLKVADADSPIGVVATPGSSASDPATA